MINKKKFLGKCPDQLGVKDAVHVAIVSCVAGRAISAGGRVRLDSNGHAEECVQGGIGVADPFVGRISRGQNFWVMVDPSSVDSVSHSWDHDVVFPVNPVPVEANRYITKYAELMGVTYAQLLQACASYVKTGRLSPYPGTLSEETVDELVEGQLELNDMWYEWANESGHEFDNMGSECCPEYEYPDSIPFEWV